MRHVGLLTGLPRSPTRSRPIVMTMQPLLIDLVNPDLKPLIVDWLLTTDRKRRDRSAFRILYFMHRIRRQQHMLIRPPVARVDDQNNVCSICRPRAGRFQDGRCLDCSIGYHNQCPRKGYAGAGLSFPDGAERPFPPPPVRPRPAALQSGQSSCCPRPDPSHSNHKDRIHSAVRPADPM